MKKKQRKRLSEHIAEAFGASSPESREETRAKVIDLRSFVPKKPEKLS